MPGCHSERAKALAVSPAVKMSQRANGSKSVSTASAAWFPDRITDPYYGMRTLDRVRPLR